MASRDNVYDGILDSEEQPRLLVSEERPPSIVADVNINNGDVVDDSAVRVLTHSYSGMELRQHRTLTEKGRTEHLRILRNKHVLKVKMNLIA